VVGKEIVKEFISRHIPAKPTRISLKLDWNGGRSQIMVKGDSLEVVEYFEDLSFSSFARGVIESYEQAFGKLNVVPISFREEIYKNDKVALHLYPTGSEGIFDIFIKYNSA